MLKHVGWVALVFSLACSTADRKPATPAPAQSTTAGTEAAAKAPECVVLQAKTESEGLDAEGRWLHEHYPGWKKLKQSLGGDPSGRKFDRLEIETPTGEKHSVCFDITSFFGKF